MREAAAAWLKVFQVYNNRSQLTYFESNSAHSREYNCGG